MLVKVFVPDFAQAEPTAMDKHYLYVDAKNPTDGNVYIVSKEGNIFKVRAGELISRMFQLDGLNLITAPLGTQVTFEQHR